MKGRTTMAQATRKAVDSYPGGLCFSMPGGRPILTNKTMNRLVFALTGHTMIECNTTWEELARGQVQPQCRSLKDVAWLRCGGTDGEHTDLFFMLEDGSVWQFQRQSLNGGATIQTTATDITEQYRMSAELYRNNCQLMALHERQRTLLQNIVQINQERERLAAKMRIHDELGQCLLGIRKVLEEGTIDQEALRLTRAWQDTLSNLRQIQPAVRPSAEAELLQVARMIGCDIVFRGPRPEGVTGEQLFYAAVREAVMNAVSHAQADQLLVESEERERDYHVTISDNGKKECWELREGVGLTGLRRCMERDGAVMRVECDGGVRLILEIPKEDMR